MDTDPRKLPICTGANELSGGAWDSCKLAVSGYAGGQVLYPLPQRTYVTPPIPVDTSGAETRRALREHTTKIQPPWFLLAQATGRSAALVVKRFQNAGRSGGREAWLELERVDGRDEMDERSTQLLALEGNSCDIRCGSVGAISDLLVRLHGTWAVFDSLGSPKTEEAKRAMLHFGARDALPQISVQLSTRRRTVHNELERPRIA